MTAIAEVHIPELTPRIDPVSALLLSPNRAARNCHPAPA